MLHGPSSALVTVAMMSDTDLQPVDYANHLPRVNGCMLLSADAAYEFVPVLFIAHH